MRYRFRSTSFRDAMSIIPVVLFANGVIGKSNRTKENKGVDIALIVLKDINGVE